MGGDLLVTSFWADFLENKRLVYIQSQVLQPVSSLF